MNARSPQAVSAPWLRERFRAPRPWTPVTRGDGHLYARPEAIRPAAVLVPVLDRDDGPTVLFTRRTPHLHDHAGQISFPGGRADPDDASARHTALREAQEEIGLDPQQVDLLGELSEYVTVTGYRVTPVVGIVRTPFESHLDEFEVAEVFEVPLAYLLDPQNHQRNLVIHEGRERHYYAVPFRHHYIWGATAGMLMNLHAFLTETQ